MSTFGDVWRTFVRDVWPEVAVGVAILSVVAILTSIVVAVIR